MCVCVYVKYMYTFYDICDISTVRQFYLGLLFRLRLTLIYYICIDIGSCSLLALCVVVNLMFRSRHTLAYIYLRFLMPPCEQRTTAPLIC